MTQIAAESVAAIVVEPVQGEGGFIVAPQEFMQGLRDICDEHGIVLVVDEVQTGFARTGSMFAIEQYGIVPDVMTFAKSIAGGLPLSAVVGRPEIMDAPGDSAVGGTYVGNPVAQAAALAVLDVIEDEGLVERSGLIGDVIRQRMLAWQERFPQIGTCAAWVRCSRSSSSPTPSRRSPRPSSRRASSTRPPSAGCCC